jgi:septal ring-binding cell division protein DamX
MGRLNASVLAVALAAVAALALASCGSGGNADLLPGGTASEITENLDTVKELVGEGECIGAENEAQEVSNQVDALGGVDKQLKQALREGADRLNQVVEDCEEAPIEETEPAIETEEEAQAPEKGEKAAKPGKSKPAKEAEEAPAETPPATTPAPPSSGEGKGAEGGGAEETPPVVEGGGTGPPSGGVGPGAPVGGG